MTAIIANVACFELSRYKLKSECHIAFEGWYSIKNLKDSEGRNIVTLRLYELIEGCFIYVTNEIN